MYLLEKFNNGRNINPSTMGIAAGGPLGSAE